MVIVILGMLAIVAIPRMETGSYRALEFHDRTVTALRYAQKTATSHRRMVCAAFTESTVTLTIDHDKSGACDGHALNLPDGSALVQSHDTANAIFDPVPAGFSFQPNGTGADRTLRIGGMSDIAVVGSTGYVQ